ncbi:uncharacterized protein LOC122976528 [Thunnus albacares]|uniref:uncharacterized protein LOC122976528 n=1 Tax=Thunnus albacares TaxID=8236 RepID=UPI001CF6721E|nr:uncharacterized protein LOC122976528 [Thunnus albacares]XP_044201099.1 uncharacterized protein LOC122976528 [Thunnus albacares]
MASSGLHREKHLLTLGILRVDERYANLPRPGPILQLFLTNLRNRPLRAANIKSMRESILSMYHSLISGSKSFPVIPFKGYLSSVQMVTPFVQTEQEQRENDTPSPLTDAPAGVMVPAADSSSSPPTMMTPVLPERTAMAALKADRRNCVRNMDLDGSTFTRVISTVYRSDSTERANRWRVTDYSTDGHVLMSALCQFTKNSAQCAKTSAQRKRKVTEEESSLSAPKKRLRL